MLSEVRPLQILSDEECLRLIARQPIGRMGMTAGALPVVVPVNIALDGDRIVFASEPGQKLDAARANDVACIEVDGYDRWAHSGWSVLATGRLREITDSDERDRASLLPLTPWALPAADHYVELKIELLSGRRIGTP